MGHTAIDILSEELLWAQDRILYAAIDDLTANLDSFPMFGFGIAFMKRSAEGAIVDRVRDRVVPDMEEHLALNIAFIQALAEADDPERVQAEFRDELLAADPLWTILNGADEGRREAIRTEILERKFTVSRRAADWLQEAQGAEYASLHDLAESIGRDADTVMEEFNDVFFYIDMMDTYRDDVDASSYSSLLERDSVHDWFLEHLINGMRTGREEVVEEFRRRIAEGHEIDKEWEVLDPAGIDVEPAEAIDLKA